MLPAKILVICESEIAPRAAVTFSGPAGIITAPGIIRVPGAGSAA